MNNSRKCFAGRSLRILALILVLAASCGGESKSPAAPQGSSYEGGEPACGKFRGVVYSSRQGRFTDAEVISKLKEIEKQGAGAEPDIRAAVADLLNSAIEGDAKALGEASAAMLDVCTENGY